MSSPEIRCPSGHVIFTAKDLNSWKFKERTAEVKIALQAQCGGAKCNGGNTCIVEATIRLHGRRESTIATIRGSIGSTINRS